MAAAVLVAGVTALAALLWVLERPQRATLLLAAFVPFDGLLLLIEAPWFLLGWKEIVVCGAALASLIAAPGHRAGSRVPIPTWTYPVLFMVAWGLLSVAWSPPAFAVKGLEIDFFYLLVPLTLWRCPLTPRDRDHLVTILMATVIVTSAFGVVQQVVGAEALNALGYRYNDVIRTIGPDLQLRSFSTFEQPFPFAFFLAFALALTLPVALTDVRRRRNQLFLLLVPVVFAGLASAVVRASLIAVLVMVIYFAIRRYGPVLAMIPLALAALVMVPTDAWGVIGSADSLFDRTDGWTAVSENVASRPFGAGIGTTSGAAEAAVRDGATVVEDFGFPPDLQPYQPDNYYVKKILELGPIGLWLFIVVLATALASARRARDRSSGTDRALADGIIAAMYGQIAAGFFSSYWEIFPLDYYFWMALGVLTCIDRSSHSELLRSDRAAAESRPTSMNSSLPSHAEPTSP